MLFSSGEIVEVCVVGKIVVVSGGGGGGGGKEVCGGCGGGAGVVAATVAATVAVAGAVDVAKRMSLEPGFKDLKQFQKESWNQY